MNRPDWQLLLDLVEGEPQAKLLAQTLDKLESEMRRMLALQTERDGLPEVIPGQIQPSD